MLLSCHRKSSGADALAAVNCLPLGATMASKKTPGGWVSSDRTDSAMYVTLPPGIGANHSLTVEIWDSSGRISSSAPLYLAYAPPRITQVVPAVLYVSDAAASVAVAFAGENLGRQRDSQYWLSGQAADMHVNVGGISCDSPSRVTLSSGSLDAIQVSA